MSDSIIELLSPSTAEVDKTVKKELCWLGTWEGMFQEEQAMWLRFFNVEGRMVPTGEEAA